MADLLAEGEGLGPEDAHVVAAGLLRQPAKRLSAQSGLAQSAFSDDTHDLSAAVQQALDTPLQKLELVVASDENFRAAARSLTAHGRAAAPEYLESRDQDLLALDLELAAILDVDQSRHPILGAFADENLLPVRSRHQARSHVDVVSHERVFLAQIRCAGIAGEHVTGVDADALAKSINAPRCLQRGEVLTHGLLHLEGGVNGPDRIVLVCPWRAEKYHQPVSHGVLVHARDGALVSFHHLGHMAEVAVELLGDDLWMAFAEIVDDVTDADIIDENDAHRPMVR